MFLGVVAAVLANSSPAPFPSVFDTQILCVRCLAGRGQHCRAWFPRLLPSAAAYLTLSRPLGTRFELGTCPRYGRALSPPGPDYSRPTPSRYCIPHTYLVLRAFLQHWNSHPPYRRQWPVESIYIRLHGRRRLDVNRPNGAVGLLDWLALKSRRSYRPTRDSSSTLDPQYAVSLVSRTTTPSELCQPVHAAYILSVLTVVTPNVRSITLGVYSCTPMFGGTSDINRAVVARLGRLTAERCYFGRLNLVVALHLSVLYLLVSHYRNSLPMKISTRRFARKKKNKARNTRRAEA
ncbi:hypothetical protein BDZ89DRAFT_1049459 [Hymenopellis radicata]|nr:hypothetical protein BDZ89DRAFT_1049459 [Hymenopellis radicata]